MGGALLLSLLLAVLGMVEAEATAMRMRVQIGAPDGESPQPTAELVAVAAASTISNKEHASEFTASVGVLLVPAIGSCHIEPALVTGRRCKHLIQLHRFQLRSLRDCVSNHSRHVELVELISQPQVTVSMKAIDVGCLVAPSACCHVLAH